MPRLFPFHPLPNPWLYSAPEFRKFARDDPNGMRELLLRIIRKRKVIDHLQAHLYGGQRPEKEKKKSLPSQFLTDKVEHLPFLLQQILASGIYYEDTEQPNEDIEQPKLIRVEGNVDSEFAKQFIPKRIFNEIIGPWQHKSERSLQKWKQHYGQPRYTLPYNPNYPVLYTPEAREAFRKAPSTGMKRAPSGDWEGPTNQTSIFLDIDPSPKDSKKSKDDLKWEDVIKMRTAHPGSLRSTALTKWSPLKKKGGLLSR